MKTEELEKLLTRLVAKTKDGTLKWKLGPDNEDEYRVNFPRSSVEIYLTQEKEPALAIYNEDGSLIEIIYPGNFSDPSAAASALATLHNQAKNAAFKVDQTFDDILENLK